MSIAVRVSVWILGVLVVISAGVAVLTLMQKQTLENQNQSLHNAITTDESQLADLNNKTKQLEDTAQQLNSKIVQAQEEKSQIQSQYDELKQKSDDLQSQLTQANSDRDDWKNRVETITQERDNLAGKLRNQPVKIVYKERIVKVPAADETASVPDVTAPQGDQYWASVLRQKAALQVELQKEKDESTQAALQVADLRKQNSDLQTQLQQVSNEKDEIVQKIKYGQDLADNLSIDLARSRNDQEAVNDRADKLKDENLQLLSQIRDLTSTKVELEKTIATLTDDKDAMQRKLVETQSVIQSRIDDIWKIKQSLDKKLSENSAGGMELPPIIVNSPAGAQPAPTSAPAEAASTAMAAPADSGKTQGTIISINEPNNFIIADLGQQNSTVAVGTPLKVYRDSTPVADLEVIQVRRDICAADIKNKTVDLKVGDIVKFQ